MQLNIRLLSEKVSRAEALTPIDLIGGVLTVGSNSAATLLLRMTLKNTVTDVCWITRLGNVTQCNRSMSRGATALE